MTAWEWIDKPLVLAIHARLLAEHGGPPGLRDEGLLEAALAKPRNQDAYDRSDVFALAAAYAVGIVRSHPFVDGNKRTGFVAAALFLELNGARFDAPEEDSVARMLALAAGALDEAEFADWLRQSSVLHSK